MEEGQGERNLYRVSALVNTDVATLIHEYNKCLLLVVHKRNCICNGVPVVSSQFFYK